MFRKLLDSASAGDNVGVLPRGTKKEEVGAAWFWPPGSINPHTKFKAEVYVFKDEVVVIRRSSPITARSSISARLT